MRPHEIDYSDTRKPYFDLENGEVLVGADDRQRYLDTGVEPENVVELGPLLRDSDSSLETGETEHEPIDTSEWPRERYAAFVRWLGRIVPKPSSARQRRVNKPILRRACRLGIGPSESGILDEFGTYTNLYSDARVGETHVRGLWDDWGVEDAIKYIKRVGGGKRPRSSDLKRRHNANPNHPTAKFLTERFRDIGGFNRLVELAGYVVVENWDDNDYLEWGVMVMRANDGNVPSQNMMRYLSTQDRGPATCTIAKRFGNGSTLSEFQRQVVARFYEHQQEAETRNREMLQRIEADLQDGSVPLELFSPFEHDTQAGDEKRQEILEKLETLYGDEAVASILREIGVDEALERYAKFKVVEEVVTTDMGVRTRIAISRGLTDGSFTASINKKCSMSACYIEYAALTEGLFDYIWSDDARLESLRMDEGYEDYLKRDRDRVRRYKDKKRQLAAV